MGVKGEKSSLFRTLIMQKSDSQVKPMTLTNEEWRMVSSMGLKISKSIVEAIEQEGYVSQNVLEYTMAKVVAMVLKLNCDMFGQVGGEADHMAVLIRHAWDEIKDQKIDYGTCAET